MCSNDLARGLDLRAAVLACVPAARSTSFQQAGRGDGSVPTPEVPMEWNAVFVVAVAIAVLVGLFS